MAVFTYVNAGGVSGIIVADNILDAAEVIVEHVNTDVVIRELKGSDRVYEWDYIDSNEWPWLVTSEIGTDYKYTICKRNDPDGTPWGDVEYTTSIIPRK